MCSCHSILGCCVTFSGVKLSIRSFVLFIIIIICYGLCFYKLAITILGNAVLNFVFVFSSCIIS